MRGSEGEGREGLTSVPDRDAEKDDQVDRGPEFRIKEEEDGDEESDKGVDSLSALRQASEVNKPSRAAGDRGKISNSP